MRAVDLFAGFGGFTEGATAAGVDVVWAANHWPLAVKAHAANHPGTVHECQDLRQADWTRLPEFDLLLAAPACQGHSTASQPQRRHYHNALRATAWAVVDCVEVTGPTAVIVENVPTFRRWQLYPLWVQALEILGYVVSELVVRASDHGVPQRRDRLFIVATRSAKVMPLAATSPERPFASSIEWRRGDWRPVRTAGAGAQKRIAAAIARCGPRCLSQHVTGHRGVPLDQPIRTVTTKDQWVIVDGDQYRPLTLRETARAMGFPEEWAWPHDATRTDVIRGLGNAVCPPVAKRIIEHVTETAA